MLAGFTAYSQTIIPGKPVRIACSGDTSQQYLLYFPAGCQPSDTIPLLLFLDPAARADVPVTLYSKLADSLHIAIAASCNSKNFDAASSIDAVPAILADAEQRILRKENAVFLSGFSGGSRMAAALASAMPEIKGVIGCGAAFAPDALPGITNFPFVPREIPYAGIAGVRDMNFEEMHSACQLLQQRGKANLLLYFDGGHQWPAVAAMAAAVAWLLQQQGISTKMPVSYANDLLALATNFNSSGHTAYTNAYLQQLSSIISLEIMPGMFNKDIQGPQQQLLAQRFAGVLDDERNTMDRISLLFSGLMNSTEIDNWNEQAWQDESAVILKQGRDKDPDKQWSGLRLLDFCQRLCSEQYGWLMQQQKYAAAYNVARVLELFKPAFTDPEWMQARAAAGLRDRARCTNHLRKIIKKDPAAVNKLLQDTLLLEFPGQPFLESLQKN